MPGHGSIGRKTLLNRASPFAIAVVFGAVAQQAAAQSALPTKGVVTSGAASIQSGAGNLSINQTSQRAVIDWNSFSIGSGAAVNFNQPGSSAATLNRVDGATPSTIAGQLNANGQVFLVNPNGIAITKSGTVNVGGGFVASTLGITNQNFNAGVLNFSGGGASAAVENDGAISTSSGGFVGLLGGSVSNSGVITSPLGKVGLGSGERATLDLTGDKFLQVAMPTDATTSDGKALVNVSGKVTAAGGVVELKAATAAKAIYNAVNVPGEINASSAVARGGAIILGGGAGGSVAVSGKLLASGARGGGAIVVSGHDAKLKGAKIAASSRGGSGGAVTVVSSNSINLAATTIDVSGATGGGAIRIGGDFHGASDLPSAETVAIDSASTLKADATLSGNGGTIAVWSNQYTSFAGAASARGGPQGGNGGYAEVSANATSHGVLAITGSVDLRAPAGATGSLLLDPYDIVISTSADSGGSFSGGSYTATGTSVINNTTLDGLLGTGNVTISTGAVGSPGTDAGNITVNAPIAWSAAVPPYYATSLTLTAANAITINAPITVPNALDLPGGLILNAAVDTTTVPGASLLKLSFGSGGSVTFTAPATDAPTRLTINGDDYTLVGSMADISGIGSTSGPLSGNYALASNITSATGFNASVVGASDAFTGVFEGLGNKISGLTIVNADNTAVGLFGTSSGTIRNLTLSGLSITSSVLSNDVGGLIGVQDGGVVQNVAVSGSVNGAGGGESDFGPLPSYVGGLIGEQSGFVVNSTSSVSVTGAATSSVGGLVGQQNSGSVIYNSTMGAGTVADAAGAANVGGLVGYSAGTITGSSSAATSVTAGDNSQVGGLVGLLDSSGAIAGSFATSPVTGGANANVGGLVGTQNDGATISTSYASGAAIGGAEANVGGLVGEADGEIVGSYATGNVSASGGDAAVGGLVGYQLTNDSVIDASYATGSVTSDIGSYIGGLVGDSAGTVESLTGSTYAIGPVSSTGANVSIGGLVGYLDATGAISGAYATGSVTSSGAGSNVGGLVGYSRGPVTNGSGAFVAYATGAVNSSGPGSNVGGVAGMLDTYFSEIGPEVGSISGMSAQNSTTSSGTGSYVGALVGWNSGSIIGSNAGSSGSASLVSTGATSYVGGLVGYIDTDGSVSTSYSTINITAASGSYVGGLAGYSAGAISTSYATGVVQAPGSNGFAGGLVGSLASGGAITDSYAMGPVLGGSLTDVGGLVGDSAGAINNAFATGAVANVSGAAGGLVGRALAGASVANGYWDILTTGQGSSGGGTGLTTNQLQGTAPISGSTYFSVAANLGDTSGATWGGGSGGLYPYLKTFYPEGVQAISGIAYTGAGVTPYSTTVNGVNFVQLLAGNGVLFNPAATGANGYYYAMTSGGALPAGTTFGAYTKPLRTVTAVTYQQSSGGVALSGVNLSGGWQIDLAGAAAGSLSALDTADAALWAPAAAPSLPNRQIDFGASSFTMDATTGVTGTLVLNGSGSVNQTSGSFTAASLALEGGGAFALTGSGNSVATIAASAASVDFAGSSALTVGAISDAVGTTTTGVSSPTGSGTATLVSGGSLTLNAPITLPSGVVTLTALGDITQSTAGVIDPTTLTVTSTAGNVILDSANVLAFLSGGSSGSFSVSVQGDFSVNGVNSGSGTVALVSKTGSVTIDTPVTLQNGNVVISAATTFINNVGAGAISTPAGFWQVYSASPTGDTFNNLNSGNTAIWDATYAGTVQPTSDRYVFAYQPTLTFSAENATKTYGTNDAAALQTSYTVAGLQPGVAGAYLADTAGTAYAGQPTLTSAGSPADASVLGGPYAIQISQGTLLAQDGYILTLSPGTANLTVTPLPLNYTITPGTGVFGETPTLGTATLVGILPGDTVTPTVGAAFDGAPVALDPSTPPGVYQQLITALSNPNYSLATTGNTADPLVVTGLGGLSPSLFAQFPIEPASTGGGGDGADGALSGLITDCEVGPHFPFKARGESPEQTLRRISQAIVNYFRRCETANPTSLADSLDQYAAELQKLAPQLPPGFRNIPGIVSAAAGRVRVAKSRAEVASVLRQAVAAIHKELSVVRSEDPVQNAQLARDDEVVINALTEMRVAVVSSGGL